MTAAVSTNTKDFLWKNSADRIASFYKQLMLSGMTENSAMAITVAWIKTWKVS